MRKRVVHMIRQLDPVSVENAVYPGTPDINYCLGWIELKWMAEWPRKENTPVLLPHFTPQQRAWLMRRHRMGGMVWVLLQCGNEWLLFDGETAATHLGKLPKGALISAAERHWEFGIVESELVEGLLSHGT